MKTFLLLSLFLVGFSMNAQSKTETEDWIVDKFKNYRTYNDEILKVENGYLYRYFAGQKRLRIKLKDITKVSVKTNLYKSTEYITLELYFSVEKLEVEKSDNSFEISKHPGDTHLAYFLTTKFITDGLKERMEKAFVHLIKQYGGNAVAYKEPF